jgi:hypothetical protein
MKQQNKLSSGEQHESAAEQQSAQQSGQDCVRDFSSPEELLRHDVAQTPVPSAIAERISHSIQGLPRPQPRSWWQRLFGGSKS